MISNPREEPTPSASAREEAVSTGRTGLDRFQGELDPAVVGDIASWADHPELGKLHASLQAVHDREHFLNFYAEALVARHLLARDCSLRVEVLTPNGRTCDFEVSRGEMQFYLHVKRLYSERPRKTRLVVSSRLRYLERIGRPYVVSVRFVGQLSDRQMQQFVTRCAEFIQHASVGDETVIRDPDGAEIGGCLIVAPWHGNHVSLAIGLPSGFTDEAPRFGKLLRKAYQQFMPGATNVILVGSSHPDEAEDFANALLGSHIERWDAHPPAGQRVAHGRADDGFWFNGRSPESVAAGWFHVGSGTGELESRLWVRTEQPPERDMRRLLMRLFGPA